MNTNKTIHTREKNKSAQGSVEKITSPSLRRFSPPFVKRLESRIKYSREELKEAIK